MELSVLLWLLLPVAATSGWLAARRSQARTQQQARYSRQLSSDYLQGLSYLLNEQPDKAIDVFVKLIDVDGDTVETHLALGALFRRRGEVNRAIRIHQNLLDKGALDPQQRALALLELGQDYQRAGLLDRAEELYRALSRTGQYQAYALRQLLDIYQQAHEWEKAIAVAGELAAASGDDLTPVIAQHWCELAETLRKQGQTEAMRQALRQALRIDPRCARASLLEAQAARESGHIEQAIQAFRRIEQQDPAYLPEVMDALHQCYRQAGRLEEFADYLRHLLNSGGAPVVMLAELIREQAGATQASEFVVQQLLQRPSLNGLAYFLELLPPAHDTPARRQLELAREVLGQLLRKRPAYQCRQCGFTCKTLHWHCPSCRQWNTIKPVPDGGCD